jgi:hypothetical protein
LTELLLLRPPLVMQGVMVAQERPERFWLVGRELRSGYQAIALDLKLGVCTLGGLDFRDEPARGSQRPRLSKGAFARSERSPIVMRFLRGDSR